MRILRSVVAAFIALNFLGWVTDAYAASDCPCKKIGPNVCIPDPDCAHRFRWRSNSYARPPSANSGNNQGFHERAFNELLAAFKAQVKRDDVSDQARIRTLRLTILQVALKAADWISPVEKALADIVHSAAPGDDK